MAEDTDSGEEQQPDFTPHTDTTARIHGYKIKADKVDEDGNSLVQWVKFQTEDVPSQRIKVNCEDILQKTVKKEGLDVEVEKTPTVREFKEETKLGKLVQQLEESEWVKIEGTITEIAPQDSDEVYHNILPNHLGTISGYVLTGEDREDYRKVLEPGESSEDVEKSEQAEDNERVV